MQKHQYLFVLLIGLMYANLSFSQTYSGGDGTAGNPFHIATKSDLHYLCEHSVDWDQHFKQTANIAFSTEDFESGGDFENGGQGFSPIGNASVSFTGSYHGGDFSIDSLVINRPSQNLVGFFGLIESEYTISNLRLTNFFISGYEYTGGLVGLSDCYIVSIQCTGIVNGLNYVGGITGNNYGTIKNCRVHISILGEGNVGGIAGQNSGIEINQCFSRGALSGNAHVGGLVGFNAKKTVNCYSTASVIGTHAIGGLTGYNNDTIINCYSVGEVFGTDFYGGLVGFNNAIVDSSFWDVETSGQLSSMGGSGKSSVEMKTLILFTDASWDFEDEIVNGLENIWKLHCATNEGYPILFWEDIQSIASVELSGSTLTAMTDDATYSWVNCDADFSVIPGETGQSYIPTTNGNYAVIVNKGSCNDTSECISISELGVNTKNQNETFLMYPNPTDGNFAIDLEADQHTISVKIFDVFGKTVESSQKVNATKLEISFQGNEGIYFVEILNENGEGKIHKLLRK